MKTCIVFGSTGLLGEAFCRLLPTAGYSPEPVTRSDVDLSDLNALSRFLEGESYDLILNCAGMTGLEQCMDNPEDAKTLNVEAPRVMAHHCAASGAKMVHFSTDYVFGGNEEKWLTEGDETQPVNLYGETKLNGEMAVLAAADSALIARVSWLFGRGRSSMVDQVLAAARSEEWPRSYIVDKYSVPNFTDDLVMMCIDLLNRNAKGLVHLSSKGPMASWHGYALEVLSCAKNLGLVPADCPPPGESLLGDATFFRAARPKWTAMESSNLERWGVTRPDWRDGLRRYLLTINLNEGNR